MAIKQKISNAVIALINDQQKLFEMNHRAREAGKLHRDSGIVKLISLVARDKSSDMALAEFTLDIKRKIHIVGVGFAEDDIRFALPVIGHQIHQAVAVVIIVSGYAQPCPIDNVV